jgi:hypothetical protein
VIPVTDLAVSADDRRFHLIQQSTGRRVEPRVTHALEAGVVGEGAARALRDLASAGKAQMNARSRLMSSVRPDSSAQRKILRRMSKVPLRVTSVTIGGLVL